MSYCVNCGVELERSLKACPLCGVTVVNPLDQEPAEEAPAFPPSRDELKKKDQEFWVGFFTILYLVPILTCVILNLLYNQRLTWSLYVAASTLMLWFFSTSPFYFAKFDYRKMLVMDLIGVLAGLLIIQQVTGGSNWLLTIALPIAGSCFVLSVILITLAEKEKIRGLGIAAAIAVAAGLLSLAVEILTDLFAEGAVTLIWSWFVVASCLSVAALLILLDRNKRFKQELAKRLHF